MKKAVIYARYSSHKQREESIERQLEICHKFAEDNDYEIIAEYCDRERTGRNDNRLNFQKMMKDAERKEVEQQGEPPTRRVSFQSILKFACEFIMKKRHECEKRTSNEMSALRSYLSGKRYGVREDETVRNHPVYKQNYGQLIGGFVLSYL